MESGDLLGVKVGWEGKWYVPSVDWVGGGAVGVYELYLARRAGKSEGGGDGEGAMDRA